MVRARVLAFLFLALTTASISAQTFPEKRITL